MGIINSLMHHSMANEAKNLVIWATESYNSIHAQYPELSDREIFEKALEQRGVFPGGTKDRDIVLDRYGSSLNGLCYYLGLNSQKMKGTMVFRCVQFTEYIDLEIEKRGFKKPSDNIKRGYFKTLGLPENAITETYLQ